MEQALTQFEIYSRKVELIELGNIKNFDTLVLENSIKPNSEGKWPVYEIIRAINKQKMVLVTGDGSEVPAVDNEKDECEIELKKQRINKLKLENEEKSGKLVSKELIQDRMLSLCRAVAEIIRYAIKLSSPRMIGLPNALIAEQILTKEYNRAIEHLREVTDVKGWEDEKVQIEQLGTKST